MRKAGAKNRRWPDSYTCNCEKEGAYYKVATMQEVSPASFLSSLATQGNGNKTDVAKRATAKANDRSHMVAGLLLGRTKFTK